MGKDTVMITIEHGVVFRSVDWPTRCVDTFHGILRKERYHLGISPPNYPVPATQDNALTANWHSLWCKCSMCIVEWLDRRMILS